MKPEKAKFTIRYEDQTSSPATVERDVLVIGRMRSCDVMLNHRAVSRIHAGINRIGNEFYVMNLSTSNSLTLNGKLLAAEETDVLADGDIIQIGPFTLTIGQQNDELRISVLHHFTGDLKNTSKKLPPMDQIIVDRRKQEVGDVLKVFWEKRTREKEERGTRLRPKVRPQPGKAMINWKPTGDLRRPWRGGIFVWTLLLVGGLSVFAFYNYPETYVSRPLSDPHIRDLDTRFIANRANQNSCTTCHSPGAPIENACISCHATERFHPNNTSAHEKAGVTCTVCHLEHQGRDFQPRIAALRGCAECHNDNNKNTYNGLTVRTAHEGSFGRPAKDGKWIWRGPYREIAETVPAVINAAAFEETEQARLSREFHALHLYRLKPAPGMKTDDSNRISCSTCHNGFDPVDRVTPYQTCGQCHSGWKETVSGQVLLGQNEINCVSCHVQHPFNQNRWSDFLTDEAGLLRERIISTQIERQKEP